MSSTAKILVLDDNVDVAQGIADILELSGYEVTLVHDARSAVATYFKQSFNMGLFDVRMPGMNGVEAFMEIKDQKPDASILLMSGYADDELVESALERGALGLLGKPFEPEAMLSLIRKLNPETEAVS
jgi:DNA-binding NtrC family response regulator